MKWIASLRAWLRDVFTAEPLTWADYAATKDWEMAEMLWREEKAKANDAAVRAITARILADQNGSEA